jgi:hypothetical protein
VNEAPKKIWMCFDDERCGEGREYIRADLVEDLVKALNTATDLFMVQKSLNAHMQAALKALEEE